MPVNWPRKPCQTNRERVFPSFRPRFTCGSWFQYSGIKAVSFYKAKGAFFALFISCRKGAFLACKKSSPNTIELLGFKLFHLPYNSESCPMFSFLFISLFRIDPDSSFITIWSYYYEIDRYPLSSLREVGLRFESYPALQRATSQEACEREKRKHDLEKTNKSYTPPSYERRLKSWLYSYPIRPRG